MLTPATIQAALKAAKGGDVLRLSGGPWGDITIKGFAFSPPVELAPADPLNPPVFNTLTLMGSGLTLSGPGKITLVPDAKTLAWTAALWLLQCSDIVVDGWTITGGNAVLGLPASTDPVANPKASGGPIAGFPIGHGVNIQNGQRIAIRNCEVSRFFQAIGWTGSDIEITDNHTHDLRKTHMAGAGSGSLLVARNLCEISNPWKYGANGDHADFFRIWTQVGDKAPWSGVAIEDNVFDQGSGFPIMAMTLEDQSGLGFAAPLVRRNTVLNGNGQGLVLSGCHDAIATLNAMLQASGDAKSGPAILLTRGSSNCHITRNVCAGISQIGAGSGNVTAGNLKCPGVLALL